MCIRDRHWFENMDEDENRPYDMEEPNFFGLSIAYDPYMREVVQADRPVSYTHLLEAPRLGESRPYGQPGRRIWIR